MSYSSPYSHSRCLIVCLTWIITLIFAVASDADDRSAVLVSSEPSTLSPPASLDEIKSSYPSTQLTLTNSQSVPVQIRRLKFTSSQHTLDTRAVPLVELIFAFDRLGAVIRNVGWGQLPRSKFAFSRNLDAIRTLDLVNPEVSLQPVDNQLIVVSARKSNAVPLHLLLEEIVSFEDLRAQLLTLGRIDKAAVIPKERLGPDLGFLYTIFPRPEHAVDSLIIGRRSGAFAFNSWITTNGQETSISPFGLKFQFVPLSNDEDHMAEFFGGELKCGLAQDWKLCYGHGMVPSGPASSGTYFGVTVDFGDFTDSEWIATLPTITLQPMEKATFDISLVTKRSYTFDVSVDPELRLLVPGTTSKWQWNSAPMRLADTELFRSTVPRLAEYNYQSSSEVLVNFIKLAKVGDEDFAAAMAKAHSLDNNVPDSEFASTIHDVCVGCLYQLHTSRTPNVLINEMKTDIASLFDKSLQYIKTSTIRHKEGMQNAWYPRSTSNVVRLELFPFLCRVAPKEALRYAFALAEDEPAFLESAVCVRECRMRIPEYSDRISTLTGRHDRTRFGCSHTMQFLLQSWARGFDNTVDLTEYSSQAWAPAIAWAAAATRSEQLRRRVLHLINNTRAFDEKVVGERKRGAGFFDGNVGERIPTISALQYTIDILRFREEAYASTAVVGLAKKCAVNPLCSDLLLSCLKYLEQVDRSAAVDLSRLLKDYPHRSEVRDYARIVLGKVPVR